jgi:hypothetical protein
MLNDPAHTEQRRADGSQTDRGQRLPASFPISKVSTYRRFMANTLIGVRPPVDGVVRDLERKYQATQTLARPTATRENFFLKSHI